MSGPDNPVEYFKLNDLRFRGCQGCGSCKTKTEFCVIKDDLARVLSAAASSDFLIVTTPIYIGEIASQLKGFVDRSYCWYKPDFITNSAPSRLKPGKKLLFIVSQGNPDPGAYQKNIDNYLGYFGTHGFKAACFHALVGIDDVTTQRPDLLAEVVDLAKSL
jgi:multimeric flavodoxin WrbA